MKFSLWYPIKPVRVNQIFGNPDSKYKELGLIGHNGIDLRANNEEPVYASHDGFLRNELVDSYGGHGVTITTSMMFDYKDTVAFYKSIYWHLLPGSVHLDGPVKIGELIGYADNTGFSTGDHLHFGLKPLDKNGNNLEQLNGYLGAINPVPYFNSFYAEDEVEVISKYQRVIELLKDLFSKLKGRNN